MSTTSDTNVDHDPAALAEALDSTYRLAADLVTKARQHGVSIDGVRVYVYPADPSIRTVSISAAIESLTPVLALALGLRKVRTQPYNEGREEIAVYSRLIDGVRVDAQWSYPAPAASDPTAVAS